MDPIAKAIWRWATRETGRPWIRAQQGQTPPEKPYGTFNFRPNKKLGGRDELRYDESGHTFFLAAQRGGTISLNMFGAGAVDTLEALRDTLDSPDTIEEFRAAGFAVIRDGAVNNLTAQFQSGFEERAQFDLEVSNSKVIQTGVGTIEHVSVVGEVEH